MIAPRVFAVQQPAFFDRVTRKFVPKYDLTPAEKYGRLVFLLGPGNIFKNRLDQAVAQMQQTLQNFQSTDYLLAAGDPVAIAAAAMIASEYTDRLTLLKWDRISESYEPYTIKV